MLNGNFLINFYYLKDGSKGRVLKIQKTVTALFKHERIELNRNRADEVRGYAERVRKFSSIVKIFIIMYVLCKLVLFNCFISNSLISMSYFKILNRCIF